MTPNVTLPPIRTELGPTTFFAGGQLCSYDGSQVVEHGFPLSPEGIGVKVAAGAGMDTGTHEIVAVYEWFDAQGQRHQSAPSLPGSVTADGAGNNRATVDVPTLLLSQKSGINIVLYMTIAGGLTFFRLPLIGSSHPQANNTSAAFVSFTVSSSDASISSNEALYTQPNEGGTTLPSDAPPPTKAICVWQNRLLLLSADNDLEYRLSQELLPSFGLQFAGLFGDETLGGLVPSESGGTVACIGMDEKAVIFCKKKIYALFGAPPDSSGNNSTLTEPQEIPSAVGCLDARSVLAMPEGVMFKAQGGFYLLGRDLSVKYIGDGVKAYDGYTVVSATLMRDRQECRFEAAFSPGVSGDGVVLVFSYLTGQWSTFFRGSSALHPAGAADALWWPTLNQYVWLATSNGIVLTGGLFGDVPLFNADGSYTNADPDDFVGVSPQGVHSTAITAWLKPSALEGFQRVRRLYITGSTPFSGQDALVTISVAFNDDATLPGAYSVSTNISSFTNTAAIDLRHKLQLQKCKSVRFIFSCVPQSSAIAGFGGIQAMALEIGFKRGVNKLPSGQTV
jgi:hypothetical protein